MTVIKMNQIPVPKKKLHYMAMHEAQAMVTKAVDDNDTDAQTKLLQFIAFGPAAISSRQKQIRQLLLDGWGMLLDKQKE